MNVPRILFHDETVKHNHKPIKNRYEDSYWEARPRNDDIDYKPAYLKELEIVAQWDSVPDWGYSLFQAFNDYGFKNAHR
jgi:hypothetical protein